MPLRCAAPVFAKIQHMFCAVLRKAGNRAKIDLDFNSIWAIYPVGWRRNARGAALKP
jgi:hypothetical protein